MAFFELRQYTIQPGQMDAWIKWSEEEIVPFQQSKGMVIVGSFVAREANLFVWIRRFESEADWESLYDVVYRDEYWQNHISPRNEELLAHQETTITKMEPTAFSIIR